MAGLVLQRRWRGAILALGVSAVLVPRPAEAIPVFARVYDLPCSACHTVYPQLNPEGERFRDHGLHGLTPAIEPIRLAPGLDVPGTLPLALSINVGESVNKTDAPDRNDRTEAHFNLDVLSILAGGELGPHLAFLADFAAVLGNPRTGEHTYGNRPGIAFLQAHHDFDGWLTNLRAGAFELPLGTSPRVHRLSVQRYLLYSATAFSLLGKPLPTRGTRKDTFMIGSPQLGGELSTIDSASRTSFALGVVTGSNNRKDNNSSKDVYARVGRGFGFHQAGLLAYYSPDVLGLGADEQALRFGPDGMLYWRRLRLMGQALAGYDSDPTDRDNSLWFWGAFVEGNLRITPTVVAILRAEHLQMPETYDDRPEGGTAHVRRRIWEVTGGAQWLLQENLKLVVETSYGSSHENVADATTESWAVTVRLATSFWPLTPPVISPWLERWWDS